MAPDAVEVVYDRVDGLRRHEHSPVDLGRVLMPIICAGNGHTHDTVDEVRACQLAVRGFPPFEAPAIRPAPPQSQQEITEGMWRLGDRIIKIQVAHHGSGRLYGKELLIEPTGRCTLCMVERAVHSSLYGDCLDYREKYFHHWEHLKGAVRMLREQSGRKMTLQEAVQFGKLYGFCCRCGTILTNESSIEAGIGPVCAGKFA